MPITPAESRIMEALWRCGPLAADEIVAVVAKAEHWGEATVKTLINRLLKKEAIRSVRVDGRHRYEPLLRRDDYVRAESQGLLDRLFGGQLAPLVSHFAQHRALSPDDIAHLKRLIEDLDDGD